MDGFTLTEEHQALREAVQRLCADFPDEYWRGCDEEGRYPQEFVDALTKAGWLAVLIPEEYGGGGGDLIDAAIVLETIAACGGSPSCAHAQMYIMGTVLRHGSEEQKTAVLPEIATGALRLQAFGVTEADAGSDTTNIKTFARREGDHYVISGSKMWTSRVRHSDLMLLLARTTPRDQVSRKTDGLSVFLIDLRDVPPERFQTQPIKTMLSHQTYAVFFDELRVPATSLVGAEGEGFRYILSGMNAERILVASEALGDGFYFVEQAARYASDRVVFNRPIGANQAIQFPLAQAYAELSAASLMRWDAALRFNRGEQPGFQANCAKLLATQAAWKAANAAMDAYGGYGLAVEYGIERKFREARLTQIAPVSNNLVLGFIGHTVLGMPRSY